MTVETSEGIPGVSDGAGCGTIERAFRFGTDPLRPVLTNPEERL